MNRPSQRVAQQRRTWSGFGDIRRVPSEYEIVTHDTNYTLRKQRDAALEQNPSSVANLWMLTYRDRSALQVDDWLGFRDPDELTYRSYVTGQDQQETVVSGILEEYGADGSELRLSESWRATLAALFTPLRFPLHGLQMCTAYLGYIAPASYITNCASFATADLLRRVSIVAYRTRQLQIACPELGFGVAEREHWERAAAWQDTRKAIELALCAYDWAESFTAVDLVLRPTLDDLWLRQLGELAKESGDEQTWLLLTNLQLDADRCRRWSAALAKYAIDHRAANLDVLRKWIGVWAPRADAAVAGLAPLLANAREAGGICEGARAARAALLARAGIPENDR